MTCSLVIESIELHYSHHYPGPEMTLFPTNHFALWVRIHHLFTNKL